MHLKSYLKLGVPIFALKICPIIVFRSLTRFFIKYLMKYFLNLCFLAEYQKIVTC